MKSHGYCSGGAWVAQQYQKYPYYYDFYHAFESAGGIVTPASVETCQRPRSLFARRGGFGATGAAAPGRGGS